MAANKNRQPRAAEIEARRLAFAGARLAISEYMPMEDAAKKVGTKRTSVQEAATILTHGTPAEIEAVEHSNYALGRMVREIRARVPAEVRDAMKRKPAFAPAVQENREFDALVWGKLRDAIDALISLPAAPDVLTIVRKNAMRVEFISRKGAAAHGWLEDFINAYTS